MKDSIKILFVEDVLSDAELNWRELEKGGIVFKKLLVDNRKDFLEGLESFKPDIIISDYSLPKFDGMQALLLRNELVPQTPFIIVTGSVNEEVAVECMKAGADDYVIKEHLTRLPFAVKEALEKSLKEKEKKAAEEAHQKSEEKLKENYSRLNLAMQSANMAWWEMDISTGMVVFEKRKAEMLGYAPEKFNHYKDFMALVHPDDSDKAMNAMRKHLDGTVEKYEVEYRILNNSGEYEWFHDIGSIEKKDSEGKPLKVTGLVIDITERKHAEENIIQERRVLRTLIDNLPDVVYVKDIECRKVIANLADVIYIGFKEEVDVLGKTDIELFKGLTGQRGYADDKKVINSGKAIVEQEEDFVDSKGVRRWLLTTKIPLHDKDGKITGLVGIGHDITERKEKEQELIRAKEKAEESDRLKSAFLTNMSHEIRTPMNGIIGFTELLKEPNLSSDDQQDFIQTIQISGARMLNTINGIVDMSKIESGLMKVDIKETNLNEKIEFTYKFFKPEVEIKGLKFLIKTGLTAKEAIIKTDNEKVYAILTNLVRNAIKFTYEGSIEFGYDIVKTQYAASLQFFVKDTGVGIPQNQKELIFERFRQGSESHTRGYEGSGLGLSICKSYVEMLGGRIWVESEEGRGSTFYFTLPYNPVSEETLPIENVVFTEDKKVQIRKLKILIVEDDEISYSLLSRMLQNISTEVLHAITGVEAVAFCRNNSDLDLVLMDIRMPRMNGLEAAQQIRQFNKEVIIIAQTAYGFSGDREKAIEAGCNDYITKPINHLLLKELINRYFNL